MTRRHLLAVTTSPLPHGNQITDGPGYRLWNLLQEVAKWHDIRILSLYESYHEGRRDLAQVRSGSLVLEQVRHSPIKVARRIKKLDPDVLFLPWSATPFIGNANLEIPTIVDYVGPGLLEGFVEYGHVSPSLLSLLLESFWKGDFYITATSRERLYLLGLLSASRRLSVGGFSPEGPLIHVVRMTPPETPPRVTKTDRETLELRVLLGGGFHPWYDYRMLADALKELSASSGSKVRLVVLGGNPRSPEFEEEVRQLFRQRGVRKHVDMTGIVPFSERERHYQSCDVALSIAPKTVEAELSARTRIVDYLWAGLPVVTTGQDEYSSFVLEAGAGFAYDPNPGSLAEVLRHLGENRDQVAAAKKQIDGLLASTFNASRVAKPVLKFIERPSLTPRKSSGWSGPKVTGLWLRDLVRMLKSGRI